MIISLPLSAAAPSLGDTISAGKSDGRSIIIVILRTAEERAKMVLWRHYTQITKWHDWCMGRPDEEGTRVINLISRMRPPSSLGAMLLPNDDVAE